EGDMDRRLENRSLAIQNGVLSHVDEKIDQQTKALQQSYEAGFMSMVKSSEERMSKQLDDAIQRAEKRLEEKGTSYREETMHQAMTEMETLVMGEAKSTLESMHKSHELWLEQVGTLLQSIPIPQVT